MGNHELLLGTLRKKEFSKEIQGVVAAVLDSRVRVPNPVGVETVFRMVGRCGKVFELCNMGMRKNHVPHPEISRKVLSDSEGLWIPYGQSDNNKRMDAFRRIHFKQEIIWK